MILTFITALFIRKYIPIDLSKKDKDDLLNVIREWVDDKIDMATKKMEGNLPDCIEYGEYISILGTDCRVYTLSLDELHGNNWNMVPEEHDRSLLDEEKLAVNRLC